MEHLCRTYWSPIYSFLRRQGYARDDAEDLTQEFFGRLLSHQSISVAQPQQGRFRSFLLGALKHYLADEQRRRHAQKRGGSQPVFSLDAEAIETQFPEPATDLTPDKIYDRCWAWTLLELALGRLREEYTRIGKGREFEVLKPFLTAESTDGGYQHAATELGVRTGTVAVTIHRLRRRFRQLVHAEVAQTVTNVSEVEDELRGLFT